MYALMRAFGGSSVMSVVGVDGGKMCGGERERTSFTTSGETSDLNWNWTMCVIPMVIATWIY